MIEGVIKFDSSKEYETDERCFINELLGGASDRHVSIARARVSPGVTTAWHELDGIEERYVILQGQGRVEVGERPPTDVGPGDVVGIPANIRQRITNTGDTDLIFLCICTPPFASDRYRDLESLT
jgi:mannose-6-phosphate isomerase-like protein (cupin superfamily)